MTIHSVIIDEILWDGDGIAKLHAPITYYIPNLGFIVKYLSGSSICSAETCPAFSCCDEICMLRPNCKKDANSKNYISVRYANKDEVAMYLKAIANKATHYLPPPEVVRCVLGACVVGLSVMPGDEVMISAVYDDAFVKVVKPEKAIRKLQLTKSEE